MTTPQTDRELLELVAKAAGVGPIRGFDYGFGDRGAAVLIDTGSAAAQRWNPLTDDGDALRLAVKLKIDIHQRVAEPRVAAVAAMHSPKIESVPDESQRLSATRAVIVRAAAAIGEQMP